MAPRSPLADREESAGARLAEVAGWQMPADFGDPEAEYAALRTAAGLIDRSHRGKVSITGPDAVKFLHNMCTNDIKNLPPGQGCEAFIASAQGRILALVLVYRLADRIWIDTAPGTAPAMASQLEKYHIIEDLEITDCTAGDAQLTLAGPRAADLLARLVGEPLAADFLTGGPNRISRASLSGVPARVQSHDSLGVPAFDLVVPAEAAATVWDAVLQRGEPLGVRPAGLDSVEVLRIEAGTPVYGRDITDQNLPQEVGRDARAISFTKGCYVGQETVARIDALGHVNRLLRGIRVPAADVPRAGAELVRAGKSVGRITSSTWSPALAGPVALAYVRRGSDAPGTELEIHDQGRVLPARVSALPFLPPAGT